MAGDYAERFHDELADKPLDRALLAGFAELVRATGTGPVADLGCGHGHVTARLQALGLTAFGIDLSPRMVAIARRAHPDLRFDEGSMTDLNLPDCTLGGIVALYSVIHIPEERLPEVFAEFYRVMAPGGEVLIAFQVGNEQQRRTEAFGRAVSLDCYWRQPDQVSELLSQAGLVTHSLQLREPVDGVETLRRAYLLARKPVGARRTSESIVDVNSATRLGSPPMTDLDEYGRPEPPLAADETATLLGFLDYQRATLSWKCAGLDAAGLTTTVGASSMTLGGMLKHLAYVEDDWFSRWLHGRDRQPPWDTVDWKADQDWDWNSAAEDTAEQLHALWQEAVTRSRALVAEALADDGLDRLARRTWPDGRAPSLRWILVHMIEEYARHNGHADLIRESVDGLTGE